MNPLNDRDITRLKAAKQFSLDALKPYRKNRYEAIEQVVGRHYSGGGSQDRVPVNFLELIVNIYSRQLMAHRPAALITTRQPELRGFASVFEAAVNDAITEAKLEDTLRIAVINAMFCMAPVKVGIASDPAGEHDAGRLYADCISLDDWVHDMTARSRMGWQFCGNRYSMRLDVAKENQDFDATARAKLTATSEGDQIQDMGEKRSSAIGRGRQSFHGESAFRERVELWDIWLPDDRLLVTLADNVDRPLRIVEDDGPANGPYHVLGYSDVPDSQMPLAPVAILRDLHDLANTLFRKIGRQAERQKTVLGIMDGGDADGERIVNANDGEVIKMLNPQNAKEYKFGGADPVTLALLLQVKDLASYFAGNLDALGGLSPQSRTLGQDELLASAASQRIADMQDRTLAFTTGIIRDFAWWEWTNPARERTVEQRIEGTDLVTTFQWTPETRRGDFLNYNFSVEPFSMAHSTPSMKLQGLVQYLQNIVFPALPLLEAQGKTLNFDSLNKTVARLGNLPEINDVIIDAGMPAQPVEAPARGDPQPTKAPVTKRTYERVNRPGGTRQGQDNVTMRALMGVNSQPEEANAVGKGVG